MNQSLLETAIRTAKHAASGESEYRSETYSAVLLFELMRSSVGETTSSRQLPAPGGTSHAQKKPYSASEFFASSNWGTEIDKVVLAGFYLEHFQGSQGYTIEDIRGCLITAKVPPPNNINLGLLQAAQKGWMMEVPSEASRRKTWILTQSGEVRVNGMVSAAVGAK